jgi:polyisoprenyl-teichoic acid--peptidoglycan teichoic acid transferase
MWAKLLTAAGSLLLVASVGLIVLVETGLNQLNHSFQQTNLLGAAAVHATSINGPINVLMVGLGPTGQVGNTDSIIVAHIPASHDRMYLVSIPRDTSVIIPAFPKTGFAGGSYKVNAAFLFGSNNGGGVAGGFQLLSETLKKTWGLTFTAAAAVNFSGFADIVRKLGGVTMYIDETTTSIHHGYITAKGPSAHAAPYNIDPNTGVPICSTPGVSFDSNPLECARPGITPVQYLKGTRHLSAYDAIDFVRCRDGLVGTDYARQRHQQQFIKAVMTEVYRQGLNDPLRLSSFISSLGKAFIFDGGGNSIANWIFTLKSIGPNSVTTIKTNDGKFVPYTGPAPDSRQALNTDSLQLLAAVRDDTGNSDLVGQFVATHQDWVSN